MSGPESNADASTEWFVVTEEIVDRGLAAQACLVVLGVLRPRATRASVDAYTDYRKAMPPDIEATEKALHVLGRHQHKGDPGMNVELDLSCVEDWELLVRYAPWSINIDLHGVDGKIANLHDCGHSISARLSPDEAARLAADLTGLHIERVDAFKARRSGR